MKTKPQALPTFRRNPFGLGLVAFYLAALALLALGLLNLYGHILAQLP